MTAVIIKPGPHHKKRNDEIMSLAYNDIKKHTV
jgi:hypothetical protein